MDMLPSFPAWSQDVGVVSFAEHPVVCGCPFVQLARLSTFYICTFPWRSDGLMGWLHSVNGPLLCANRLVQWGKPQEREVPPWPRLRTSSQNSEWFQAAPCMYLASIQNWESFLGGCLIPVLSGAGPGPDLIAMGGSQQLLCSFVHVPAGSPFPIQNLPYGVFRPDATQTPRPGVAIGDHVLDLRVIAEAGLFSDPLLSHSDCFLQESLNGFMGLGRPAWLQARATLQRLLSAEEPTLRDNPDLRSRALRLRNQVKMELPAAIGDYTDFYSSKEHAVNCGTMFRGPANALNPNWLQMPIAYHGRSSSVVISETDVIRPCGQTQPANESSLPEFKPSASFDFELEMALFVGPANELGKPIKLENAADHIFGLVLMNDWSARDIQKWEYVPLGPFLGKNFGTIISPWIVTLEALQPFTCEAPIQDPSPLPYLRGPRTTFDIPVQVAIRPEGEERASVVSRSNFKYLYWTMLQQIAHHTVNGCNLRPGDLLASGTISGPEPQNMGSMIELSWGGKNEVKLEHGGTRKFLEDGDEVIMTASCVGPDFIVGFGECRGRVLPSKQLTTS